MGQPTREHLYIYPSCIAKPAVVSLLRVVSGEINVMDETKNDSQNSRFLYLKLHFIQLNSSRIQHRALHWRILFLDLVST